MKKIYFLIFSALLCCTVFKGFSQVLYENNTSAGLIYNPGLGTGSKPIIVFDDINVPVSRIIGADSIGVTLVKVAIGRAASAPAVTVNIYITDIDPAASSFDSLPAVPPVFLTSFDLPASGPSTLLSVGDSITPFFKFKADTGYIFPGFQTFFIGVSFSTPETTNGWIFSTGPDASDNVAFEYDSLDVDEPRYAFNFGTMPTDPEASFYAQAYGKVIMASPTPVTLKDFIVTKKYNQNIVTWKTETEINTSFFKVERSKDGVTFENIGQVTAAGNSNSPLYYTFIDNAPAKGINYYRLRTVDKDNSIAFSVIRNVRNDAVADINIYPNPFTDYIKIYINSEISGKGHITITDFSGRLVYNRQIQLLPGNNTTDVDIKNFPPGSYAVKIKLNGTTLVKKIAKQ